MTTPPSDCRCDECGICYHDHRGWHHLWQAKRIETPPAAPGPTPILVDTETAAYSARRTVRIIYQWANQGRLTRHGAPGKGNARWNLHEIPAWDGPESGKPRPSPPPVKPENFQDRA